MAYTVKGVVSIVPVLSCSGAVVVHRYRRPPKCTGWRLVQSLAWTWFCGNVKGWSALKGKPSQVKFGTKFNKFGGHTKVVESL